MQGLLERINNIPQRLFYHLNYIAQESSGPICFPETLTGWSWTPGLIILTQILPLPQWHVWVDCGWTLDDSLCSGLTPFTPTLLWEHPFLVSGPYANTIPDPIYFLENSFSGNVAKFSSEKRGQNRITCGICTLCECPKPGKCPAWTEKATSRPKISVARRHHLGDRH